MLGLTVEDLHARPEVHLSGEVVLVSSELGRQGKRRGANRVSLGSGRRRAGGDEEQSRKAMWTSEGVERGRKARKKSRAKTDPGRKRLALEEPAEVEAGRRAKRWRVRY